MGKEPGNGSVNEMESIQKGLEAFLQEEMQKELQKETGRAADDKRREPQIFDIEKPEKELDVITKPKGKQRRYSEEYLEDWDSRERRRAVYRDIEDQEEDEEEPKAVRKAKNTGKRKKTASRKSTDHRNKSRRYEEDDRPSKKGKNSQQEEKKSGKKQKKKKSRLKRFLIIFILILALLLAGLYFMVGIVYNGMRYEEISSLTGEPMKEDGVVNILLIGNDSRENGEDGRSDAMILLSISNKTKKIYMTSLLRDMYVDIPGHDGNRLNAAYSYGGAELLMETIEQNLGITVNRYMLVNFEAFANLVDAVGGVDLELTSQEVEYVNGFLVEYNILLGRAEGTDYLDTSQSGLVHLNGPQALSYSRNRLLGTDFGRTERQRKVLEAVIKKLPLAMVTNPKELLDGLLPNLTTNLTQFETYQLGLSAGKLITYDLEQLVIPQSGTYSDANIRGMAVLQVDFEANRQYLEDALYGTDVEE